MRKFTIYSLQLTVLALIILGILFFVVSRINQRQELISPVSKDEKVLSLNQWFPKHLPAGRQEFLKLMNEKTKQLGMKDTNFVNPTGLDEDSGNTYSTAFDLAILTRHIIKNYPEVVEISKTEHIIMPLTNTHQDYEMYSGINLLTTYPGVVGFKTGYTPEAGLTIITLARKNNHEVIGVILGSDNRREETKELLDYSFAELK